MRIAFFNAKPHDRQYFAEANAGHRHAIAFPEARLETAVAFAARSQAICAL